MTKLRATRLIACVLLIGITTPRGWAGDPLRPSRFTVIEDFDDGSLELRSFPVEDQEPDEWALDAVNTYQGSPYSLRLFGNTWKVEDIQPVQVDSGDVWEIAAYVDGNVEIHGLGIMDSAHVVFYSLAGTEQLDIATWVTVYQGAFPSGKWNTYLLPVADDWLAYFGYVPLASSLVFVCDKDGGGGGSVYFDHLVDISDELPASPQPSVTWVAGRPYVGTGGLKNVDIQFFGDVLDPDSQTHQFLWDFGDDSTSTEQNPSHTYLIEDDHPYCVVLAVVDSTELWGWASCEIEVDPGPTSFPVTMNFVGDIMLARGYEQSGGIIPTQGVEAIFEPTLSILGQAAEVTVANMESPLTDATEHHPTKPIYFKSSPENVAGLVYAGIDVVTVANNHIYDYLVPGLQQTQSVLEANGILHSGAGIDSYEAYLPVFHTESGVSVAFLASSDRTGQYNNYQPYLNAGLNKPGFAHMTAYDIGQQITTVRDHADLVIVETHSGDEYGQVPLREMDLTELADPYGDEDYVAATATRPTTRNRAIRQAAIDAGASLVISHHPHVVQGFEVYNGRLIAHSLGNFIFDLRYPETFPTVVLNAEADDAGFYEFTVSPAYIDDWIPVPARGGLGLQLLDYLAQRSRELDTYLYVDREQGIGMVHLDTLTMPRETVVLELCAPLEFRDGHWTTAPLRVARRGNVSSIDDIAPGGGWHYRLGKERLWWGSCEDEGCTLWNLNSPSEWYDSTESYHGSQSIRHRRYSDSSGIVVTNLEWRLKRFEQVPTTLHGMVTTQNGAGATVEIRYHDSRYGSTLLGTEDVGTVNGDTTWTLLWAELSPPEQTLYYDVRTRSDCPASGEAFSWFDDIGLVEWTEWRDPVSSSTIVSPNDWYYLQLRCDDPIDSAVIAYTETSYGPMYWPSISVDPEELAASLMVGQQDTAALAVANLGTGTTVITLDPDVPWVACIPRVATLHPGERVPFSIVLTASDLDAGSYGGLVALRTDDPGSTPVGIPVSLHVTPLAVGDLTITVVGQNAVLAWSLVDQATGYRVYRSTSVGGPWELLSTTALPMFEDIGAANAFGHSFYRVTIITPDGKGGSGERHRLAPSSERR